MHGKVKTKTELQHLTHEPGFVWLRSLQRHCRDHGISKLLDEQESIKLPTWLEVEMPCTPSSPSGHQADSPQAWNSTQSTSKGGGVPHSDSILPREACLSTFQVTAWYVVQLCLKSCIRCGTTLWITRVWDHAAHLLPFRQSRGACLSKLWKLDLEEGENFAISAFAEPINSRRGVESHCSESHQVNNEKRDSDKYKDGNSIAHNGISGRVKDSVPSSAVQRSDTFQTTLRLLPNLWGRGNKSNISLTFSPWEEVNWVSWMCFHLTGWKVHGSRRDRGWKHGFRSHLWSQLVEVLKINETAIHSRDTEVEQSKGGVPENNSTQK